MLRCFSKSRAKGSVRSDRSFRSYRTTEPPNHRTTEPPNHRTTETPKHRNTETPKHRNTETPKHRNTETPLQPPHHQHLAQFHAAISTFSISAFPRFSFYPLNLFSRFCKNFLCSPPSDGLLFTKPMNPQVDCSESSPHFTRGET